MLWRTTGVWGVSLGRNLTPAEVDANFWELRSDLDDVIANPPTANSIASMTVSGLTFSTTLTGGQVLGPFPLPVAQFRWRGAWAPLTLYDALDAFSVDGEGIFSVMVDHTSAATFDPAATTGSPPEAVYNQLIGVGTNAALGDLSDVDTTGAVVGDVLTYNGSPAGWGPGAPAPGAFADLSDVDVTGAAGDAFVVSVSTGSPAVITWEDRTPAQATALLVEFAGDTGSPGVGGVKGLVPAPADGDADKYLKGDGTWADVPEAGITALTGDVTATGPGSVAATLPTVNSNVGTFDLATLTVNAKGLVTAAAAGAGDAISDLPLASGPASSPPALVDVLSLMEIAEPSGSPPTYTSKHVRISDILDAGEITLGSTAIAFGSTVTTITGLTLSGGTLSGNTALPAAGVLNSIGQLFLGYGTTLSFGGSSSGHALQIASNSATARLAFVRYGANALAPQLLIGKSRAVDIGSAGAVISGDTLAQLRFFGDDGSGANALAGEAARINIIAGGTVSTGVVPGQVGFLVANLAGTLVERMGIFPGGDLRQGTGAAIATTATDGFFLMATCAGPPTGVPTNAGAGQIPMVYDKTNNRIYAYNGAWRMVAVA